MYFPVTKFYKNSLVSASIRRKIFWHYSELLHTVSINTELASAYILKQSGIWVQLTDIRIDWVYYYFKSVIDFFFCLAASSWKTRKVTALYSLPVVPARVQIILLTLEYKAIYARSVLSVKVKVIYTNPVLSVTVKIIFAHPVASVTVSTTKDYSVL